MGAGPGAPAARRLSIFGPTHERAPVVSFTVDGWQAEGVSRVLSEDYGIGVRDGKFCAHIFVDALLARSTRRCGAGAREPDVTSMRDGSVVPETMGTVRWYGPVPEVCDRFWVARSQSQTG